MTILRYTYLLLALAFGTAAVVETVRLAQVALHPIFLLINFSPAIAFLTAYGFGRNTQLRRFHYIAVPLLAGLAAFWGFFIHGLEQFHYAVAEVTDVSRYERIMDKRWGVDRLAEHFPRPIPDDARNVRFSFRPGFLQGGAHLQLRYDTTPEIIDELYEKFSRMKTRSYFGGSSNKHMNEEYGMPTTYFYTAEFEHREFPDDYEIMIFDKIRRDRPEGFYWNHAECHGVAISKKRNEIVYWAEYW